MDDVCTVSVFVTFAYFVMNGWIEFALWTKFVRMLRHMYRMVYVFGKHGVGVVTGSSTTPQLSTDKLNSSNHRPLSSELDAVNFLGDRDTLHATNKDKQ